MENDLADLHSIQDPSPVFWEWVKEMLSGEGEYGEMVTEAIIRIKGPNVSPQEALAYLAQIGTNVDLKDLKLACADFKEYRYTKKFSDLREALGRQKRNNLNFVCGQIGHEFINKLAAKNLEFKRLKRMPKILPQSLTQLSFDLEPKGQISLFGGMIKKRLFHNPESVLGDFIDARRIESKWQKAVEIVESHNGLWPDWYFENKRLLNDLLLLLSPLIGPESLKKINRSAKNNSRAGEFISLSVLTWASAVTHFRKAKPRIIFPEVPVFPNHSDFSGGRVDFIEVVQIENRPPTKRETEALLKLAKFPFRSFEHLAKNLFLVLGKKPLMLKIGDWKFYVGDCQGKGNLVSPIRLPQPKHTEQVKKYLLFCQMSSQLPSVSFTDELIPFSGELTYLLPTSKPLVCDVQFQMPAQQHHFYSSRVLEKLPEAERKAMFREITNNLLGTLIQEIKNAGNDSDPTAKNDHGSNGHKGVKGNNGRSKNRQLSLIPEISVKKIIVDDKKRHDVKAAELDAGLTAVSTQDLILYDQEVPPPSKKEAKFLEPRKIIEIVAKKDGTDFFLLHVDRLFTAIESGSVYSRRGINARGGLVRCIVPDHEKVDRTPSLYVSFQKMRFKCFGCGITGGLTGLPKGFETISPSQSDPAKWFDKDFRQTAIPEENQKIMALAQQIYQSRFKNSDAAKYLASRSIDPELAFDLGAGFATLYFINDMLDAGVEFQKLLQLGFLGISTKLGPWSPVATLLRRRGFDEEQIKVGVKDMLVKKNVQKDLQDFAGFPYLALNRMVTFPLDIDGKITNFYGRKIDPCESGDKHRKLSQFQTGMPQGAFNLTRVLQSGSPQILVAESAIDVLSLYTLGFPWAGALVGTSNYLPLDLLADTLVDTGRQIGFALNWDFKPDGKGRLAGQWWTEYYLKYLPETRKFNATFDFTGQLMQLLADRPEFSPEDKNDYNSLLVCLVKNKVFPFVYS